MAGSGSVEDLGAADRELGEGAPKRTRLKKAISVDSKDAHLWWQDAQEPETPRTESEAPTTPAQAPAEAPAEAPAADSPTAKPAFTPEAPAAKAHVAPKSNEKDATFWKKHGSNRTIMLFSCMLHRNYIPQ